MTIDTRLYESIAETMRELISMRREFKVFRIETIKRLNALEAKELVRRGSRSRESNRAGAPND